MSKSIGKLLGGGGASTSYTPAETQYLSYLKNYDTSLADNASQNMAQSAYDLSQTLSSRPNYVYSVDGSDAARQQAIDATYNSYVDLLTPQFSQQTSDLQTRLANQGLSVGSEAYQRAMNDLQSKQNESLNQAVYASVLNGQNAFSQSLKDSIDAAQFSNSARQLPINEIYALLQNTPTAYQNNQQIYQVQSGADNRIMANKQANEQAQNALGLQVIKNGIQGAATALAGPVGGVASGLLLS